MTTHMISINNSKVIIINQSFCVIKVVLYNFLFAEVIQQFNTCWSSLMHVFDRVSPEAFVKILSFGALQYLNDFRYIVNVNSI
jgi:hypothetical protein